MNSSDQTARPGFPVERIVVPEPRWTFACTRCDWIGRDPRSNWMHGFCDCPACGNSCTTDEPSFEPRAGCLDGSAAGFEPVWPPNAS